MLPWYALWLLPLLVLRDEPAALLFTGTVSLAYLVYPAFSPASRGRSAGAGGLSSTGPCALVAAWDRAGRRGMSRTALGGAAQTG